MTALRFLPPSYDTDRHLLRSGDVDVGAVFPPIGNNPGRLPWVWRCWVVQPTREGRAASEQAAKNALMGAYLDWLRRAALEVAE
jgi:hypothetical protein